MKQRVTCSRGNAGDVCLAGQRLLQRHELMATTALRACAVMLLALPSTGRTQPAPSARPTGGAVVAGQAGIAQTAAQTTVSQSSQRAIVDWTSYDVGSSHTVVYQQPGPSSITLNRVTGPDPSQIAGTIKANGQVAIVNGSGVTFYQGSQVDVQSLVVSSANVTNAHFMAGKMAFDQPGRPDAKISNAGSITVKQTGLAALVAPQVSNSGTITAKLGHVVLAGAEASTVDLYGDGLMSVDVTRQVTRTPSGATALVTNTGTVVANGGTIVLTAQAADGIVQNLVSAKGTLRADSAGGKAGAIVVSAIGGSITIEGGVHADGKGPGTPGGTVQLAATDTVVVGAKARISANGTGGGGTIAIGTTLARAQAQGIPAGAGIPAGSARLVTVAAGAKISADGKGTGSGGTVALLSTAGTRMAGAITARGGARGGNGGQVEISATTGLTITGTVDTTAPAGKTGTLLLDPDSLVIGSDQTTANPVTAPADNTADTTTNAETISAADFNNLNANGNTNNINLQATTLIALTGTTPLTAGSSSVTLTGGTAASIRVGVSLTTTGAVVITGGSVAGREPNVSIDAAVSGGSVAVSGGSVAVSTTGSVTGATRVSLAADALTLSFGSAVSVGAGGTIAVAPLTPASPLTLSLANLAVLTASSPATLVLGSVDPALAAANSASSIAINGVLSLPGGTLDLETTGAVTQVAAAPVTAASLTGKAATVDLGETFNAIGAIGAFTAGGNVTLNNGIAALVIAGPLSATGSTVSLAAGDITESGGAIMAATLTGSAGYSAYNFSTLPVFAPPTATSSAALTGANAIGALGPFYATGGIGVTSSTALTVGGPLIAGVNQVIALAAPSIIVNGALQFGSVAGSPPAFVASSQPATLTQFSQVSLQADQLAINASVAPLGGAVFIAPLTAGRPLTIDAVRDTTNTSLSLVQSDFNDLATLRPLSSVGLGGPQQVVLGGLPGGTTTAGSVAINSPLALTNVAATLGLFATAAITQASTSGIFIGRQATSLLPAETGTITGGAGGAVQLVAASGVLPANHFDVLGPFQAGAGLSVADSPDANSGQSGLLVTGTVSSGTGSLSLLSAGAVVGSARLGGTIAIGSAAAPAVLDATGQVLTLTARDGVATAAAITQAAASSVRAGTLTASAQTVATAAGTPAYDILLNASVTNGIDALGQVSVGTPSGAAPNTVVAVQGAFSLADAGSLTVAGPVTAKAVTISAANITVNGAIGACAVSTDAATGVVTLTTPGTLTLAATVGGENKTVLEGDTGVIVDANAFVEAGRSGTGARNGSIQVTGPLTLNAGVVSASAVSLGAATQNGGSLLTPSLTVTGGYTFNAGTIDTTGALAVSASGLTAGASITAGGLTVTGTGATFESDGSLFSSGALTISVPGSFNQAAGFIAAQGKLTVASTASAGTVGAVSQSGGVMTATTGIELYSLGTGAAAIAGSLGTPVLQVIEPDAAVTFKPAALTGSATITLPSYTAVYHCPGCDGLTPGATLLPGSAATVAGTTATTVRLDGVTLDLAGSFTTGTLELHSAGATMQEAAFTAASLLGTAGYTATAAASGTALPTYDTPTAGTPGVTLTAANALASLGPYYTAGGLAVTSSAALTVVDQIAAGGNQLVALTAPSIAINDTIRFGTVAGGAFAGATRPPTRDAGIFTAASLSSTATQFSQVSLQADQLAINASVAPLGGAVFIAPLTAGRPLTIDAVRDTTNTSLSLVQSDFNDLATLRPLSSVGLGGPQQVVLGGLPGGTTTAGSVAINSPLALTNVAATLGLFATAAITQASTSGIFIGRQATSLLPAETGTITGGAGGAVQLVAASGVLPANHFDVLGPFQAGAGLSVADSPDANSGQSGLLVTGTVSSGTGSLSLLSAGAVVGSARLGGTIAIGSAAAPAVLDATGQVLTLTARDGVATAAAITQAAASSVRAGTLTASAQTVATAAGTPAYDILLNASVTNGIDALGQVSVGTPSGAAPNTVVAVQGAFSLADAGSLTVAGPVTAKAVTISAANITVNGAIGACAVSTDAATGVVTLTTPGTLTLAATVGGENKTVLEGDTGVIVDANAFVEAGRSGTGARNGSIQVTGPLTLNAGVVSASAVSLGAATQNGGSLLTPSLTVTGGYTFNAGTIDTTGALAVSASGLTAGASITAGDLTVTGTGATFESDGSLFSSGALTISVPGSFNQAAGFIAAQGKLTVASTASAGTVGAVSQSGGVMTATTGIELYSLGTGAAAIAGSLGTPVLQVIEPDAAVTFKPAALTGSATITLPSYTAVYHCPGCDGLTPSATLLPGSAATVAGTTATTVRLDGVTLDLAGSFTTGTLELHSAGATMQEAAFTAASLLGTAGYTATAAASGTALPTYDTPAAGTPGVTLTAANALASLGPYYTAGGLAVTSSAALTVVDQIAAGGNQLVALTAPSIAINDTIRFGTVAGGAFAGATRPPTRDTGIFTAASPPSGLLTLTSTGAVTEAAGGLIAAGTLTGTAATALLAPTLGNQIATLGMFTTTGAFSLSNAQDLVVAGAVLAGSSPPAGTAPPLTLAVTGALAVNGGSLTAGTVTIDATGAVTEPAGFIAANTLGVNAAQVTANAATNTINTVSGITAANGIGLTDAVSLTTSGALTAASGPISLVVTGNLTTQQAVTAGQAVQFQASGATVIASTSAVSGASVASSSGGAASVSGSIGGGVVQVTANGIGVTGAISGGAVTLSAGAGALIEAAGATIAGSSVTGSSAGATQIAGMLDANAGPLTLTAASIDIPGAITAGTTTLTSLGALTEDASGSITSAALTATSTGATQIAGTLTTNGNPLTLTAASIDIPGAVTAGPAMLTSQGALTEDATGSIKTIALTATSTGATKIAGSLTTNGGALALTASSIDIPGIVAAGPTTLTSLSTLTEDAGASISTAALTAVSTGAAQLSGPLTTNGNTLSLMASSIDIAKAVASGAATLTATQGMLTEEAGASLNSTALTATSAGPAKIAGTLTTNGGPLSLTASSIDIASTVTAGVTMLTSLSTLMEDAGASISTAALTAVSTGAAQLSGPLTTNGNTLSLMASSIDIAKAVASGAATLTATQGMLTEEAGASLNSTALTATSAGPAKIAGTLTTNGGPLSLTASSIDIASTVTAGVTMLTSQGTLTEDAGGSINSAALTAAATGAAQIAGKLTTNGNTLSVMAASIDIPGAIAAGTITLAAKGGALTEDAAGSVAGTALTATSTAATQIAGKLTTSNGPLTLKASSIDIPGAITAGATTLTSQGALIEDATGSVSTASLTAASQGATQIAGALTTNGGALSIAAASIDIPGTVSAGAITLTASQGALTEDAKSSITGASLAAMSSGSATVAGKVTLNGGPLSIAAGSIDISNAITAGVVTLTAGQGPLTEEAAGSINAASLTATSPAAALIAGHLTTNGGALSLMAGSIDVSGTLAAGATNLASQSALTLEATASIASASLTATSVGAAQIGGKLTTNGNALTLTAASIDVPGAVAAGAITLTSQGGLTEEATGSLIGASLAATAVGPASIAGTVGTAGAISLKAAEISEAPTGAISASIAPAFGIPSLTLTAPSVTLGGALSAALIEVNAPFATLAGGSITVGGSPQAGMPTFAALPTAATAIGGLFIENAVIVTQTGQTTVRPTAVAQGATVRVDLTGSMATVMFADLVAPATTLILGLGDGKATGTVNVTHLDTIYNGTGGKGTGSAELFGLVNGLSGIAAAGASQIFQLPVKDSETSVTYRINACPIASVNCVVIRPQVTPIGNPLKDVILNFLRQQNEDDDVLLPNITDQGL